MSPKNRNTSFSWEKFYKLPIVGIARNLRKHELDFILPIYIDAGFTNLEITMNTPDAATLIEDLVLRYGGVLNIGAGTVCSLADFECAIAAGASYIVTPMTDIKIIHACKELDIPIFCGALTPTEILTAWNAGADMVKIFPSASFGPAYIKEIKGPYKDIKLLPTGGIGLENCHSYMVAGASGLGMGSQLFDHKCIDRHAENEFGDHLLAIKHQLTKTPIYG